LAPFDPATGVPDDATQAVRTAFEIELGGRDFYVAAAKHTSDEALHDMFHRLAEMEREHIATLVRRYHLPPPDDATGDLHPGVLQAGAQRTPDDPLDLLQLALTLEHRAEEFFLAHVDDASPAARELYRELAAEEGEHVALLTTELAALRANRRGLL
jgi:rubrerythrin